MYEYKPPSLLVQYRGLLIVFLLVIVVAVVYLIRAPSTPLKAAPVAPEPVYVEPIAIPSAPPGR
jgi:hypothetical protein